MKGQSMSNPKERLKDIEDRLDSLPKGTLTYKTINGKKQPYIQRTIDGKSVSYYIKLSNREEILLQFEERSRLLEEKKHLLSYVDGLKNILDKNPMLDKRLAIGYQDFGFYMSDERFYVDKTLLIKEWWETDAQVCLITRPRRFGKTLSLSMIEHFFSPELKSCKNPFEKFNIWKEQDYRELYGNIPVIFISFGAVKGDTFESSINAMIRAVHDAFEKYEHVLGEYKDFKLYEARLGDLSQSYLASSIKVLTDLLYKHYKQKPIILLDEYDTPLTEGYTYGYWDEMISVYRAFFNNTFKQGTSLGRGLITGVTRVAKNSLYSDANNIKAFSVTDDRFSDKFGFTKEEVEAALICHNIDEMQTVKAMYDGFIFGKTRDIYNPWSIVNYMDSRQPVAYWINSASNDMIGHLIRKYPKELKLEVEDLMQGKSLHKEINENIVYEYLEENKEIFWSLLLATGYIKADNVAKDENGTSCDISITNRETRSMFENQIIEMFSNGRTYYSSIEDALLKHKLEELNYYVGDMVYDCVSFFDTGKGRGNRAPENFYHGFVLGLLVRLKDRYQIKPNRESGLGRYDICLIPLDAGKDAFVLEFKIKDDKKEKSLEETADRAIDQAVSKEYTAELESLGIPAANIYIQGWAFENKDVLIKEIKA